MFTVSCAAAWLTRISCRTFMAVTGLSELRRGAHVSVLSPNSFPESSITRRQQATCGGSAPRKWSKACSSQLEHFECREQAKETEATPTRPQRWPRNDPTTVKYEECKKVQTEGESLWIHTLPHTYISEYYNTKMWLCPPSCNPLLGKDYRQQSAKRTHTFVQLNLWRHYDIVHFLAPYPNPNHEN